METHVVYCSACDRQVRLLFAHPPGESPSGGEVDPSGICVDYCSGSCTGQMCALLDVPPAEVLERLKASGLLPEARE